MIPRPIKITPVLNGFIVEVGCQVVVFNSRDSLITELENYLAKPKEQEDLYAKSAIHSEMIKPLLEQSVCPTSGPHPRDDMPCMAQEAPRERTTVGGIANIRNPH